MRQVIASSHTRLAAHTEAGSSGEGSEGHHEESHDDAAIKAQWGILFVTIIIALSIAFERGTDYIREATPEELKEVSNSTLLVLPLRSGRSRPPLPRGRW